MATRIQLRRGTASDWSSNSTVVLSPGEIGFETDTGKFKIGNSASATWSALPYYNTQTYSDSAYLSIATASSTYLTQTSASTNYQPKDTELTALAGLTSAADRLPYFTGSGTASLATFTSFGRSLVDDTDAATARTTLGLGTMAVETASNYLTTTTASSTYLTQASASSTYLTQASASSSYQPAILSTSVVSASAYTLVLSDANKLVELSNATSASVTIPLNASVAFPVGAQINILQTGGSNQPSGSFVIQGASGVTVNATPAAKLRTQWSSATLIKRGTDTWVVVGDLTS